MLQVLVKIRQIAERYPDHIAIAENNNSLNYAELGIFSDNLAFKLNLISPSSKDTVAYLGKVDIDMIVALLAAHKAGRAFVHLDNKLPNAALLDIINHARITTVMTGKTNLAFATLLCAKLNLHVVAADDNQQAQCNLYQHTIFDISDNDLSHIRYTSGSSGNPKGVPLSRGHVDAMLEVFNNFLTPGKNDRFGLFGHFWPLVMLRALSVGARLDCFDFPSMGASALNEWMIKQKITHVFTYPVLFRQLMNVSRQKLSEVCFVHLSGEPISKQDIRLFEARCPDNARLHNSYGTSEYPWIAGYIHRHGEPINYDHVPLGSPVAPALVRLLNQQGQLVKTGQTGEIVVVSDFLPNGYYRDGERSAKTFRAEPALDNRICYRTGDLGYFDEYGLLHGAGRNDQQLKIRGYNVSPVDIENTLVKHPGINQAVVVPYTDADNQKRLACHYTAVKELTLSDTDLTLFLSQYLPNQLIPTYFNQQQSLPLTHTGKLDRLALYNALPERRPSTTVDSDCKIKNTLSQLWSELLEHNRFDHDDDFFNVGGDSLLAISMLVKIEKILNQRLTLEMAIVNGFTINSLVQLLHGGDFSKHYIIFNEDGDLAPVFLTHLAGGHFSDYLPMIEQLRSKRPAVGLYPRGMTSGSKFDLTITDMANHCIQELEKHSELDNAILVGYSFGALVAFSMAQQITKNGKSINHLILIDPPIHFSDPLKLFKEVGMPLRVGQWNVALYRFYRLLPYLSGFGKASTDIDSAHRTASLRFKPDAIKLNHTTTLILASNNPKAKQVELTWAKLLCNQVKIIKMHGTHRTLMKPPNVEKLSKQILSILETTQHLSKPSR